MFEVIKDGARIAYVSEPNYIFMHEEGFYALCEEDKAQGIAIKGAPYNLYGREPMEGLETVILQKVDAGTVVFNGETKQESTVVEVTDLQLALVDVYENTDTQLTDLQLAVTELYELMLS